MNTQYAAMKNWISATLLSSASAFAFILCSHTAFAQAPEENFRFMFLGYRSLQLANPSFSHDTHPDDSFLPDSDIPGSAGTTELGGAIHFLTLGIGYQSRLSDSVSINLDAGCLLGANRDRRQNANDSRPAANGAFVYSQARFGMFAAAGLSYHIKGFSLGVEAWLASILVEAGWDRNNSDETRSRKVHHQFSAGPKIGYRWKDGIGAPSPLGVEGTVQFNQSVTFGAQIVLNF